MTFRFYSLLCVMTLSLLATMGSAQAVTYIADDVSGIWTSADPASAASGLGTNEIRWGTPATSHGQSGYRFDNATPPPVVGNVGDTFVLGTFTHMNWPITGTAITSAELSVSFDLTIDGVIFNDRVFSYMFEHEETPNSLPDPRDIVTFVGASAEQTVFANGKNYTVEILGFEVNGNIVSQFLTKEKKMNSADLIARIREVGVPEPSTYLSLGTLLAFAACAQRRRKSRVTA